MHESCFRTMTDYQSQYDYGADLLTIKEEDAAIQRSLKIGDITLDFDSDGGVVGMEALNASENIMLPEEIDEDVPALLDHIVEADLAVNYRENSITVVVKILMAKEAEETKEEPVEGLMQTPSPMVSVA